MAVEGVDMSHGETDKVRGFEVTLEFRAGAR